MNAKAKILNQKNNELDKQINAENSGAMTDMVCYLRGANISEYHQEMVRQDLLEMVLSAQARGEDMKTVIGEDYKTFCDEVIQSLPKRSKTERFWDLLDTILFCTSIIGAIRLVISKDTVMLIYNAITGAPLHFMVSVTVSNLLTYGITFFAAFLIVRVICKTALRPHKKPSSKLKRFIVGGLIGGGVFAVFLGIAYLGKQTLFTMNIFAAAIIVLVLFIAHKILQRVLNV